MKWSTWSTRLTSATMFKGWSTSFKKNWSVNFKILCFIIQEKGFWPLFHQLSNQGGSSFMKHSGLYELEDIFKSCGMCYHRAKWSMVMSFWAVIRSFFKSNCYIFCSDWIVLFKCSLLPLLRSQVLNGVLTDPRLSETSIKQKKIEISITDLSGNFKKLFTSFFSS